jgi:EAL and modified HD-GYP domain-containing signal transduction protein
MVRAMNVLRDDRATDADARAVFCADLGLSHKLLRMVSLAAREAAGADSARHATQRTGRTELRKWLALLLVSSIAARGGGSRELVQRAVQRGRMCELLAGRTAHHCDSGSHFLVGLFSLLDALSGMPMPELLDAMELAPALREALVLRAGPYAPALVLVEAYEQAAWETVAQLARLSGRSAAEVGACYIQSLAWTRRRLLSLAAA